MTVSRTSWAPEILLTPLRRNEADPIYRQLERQLRDAVRSGRLAPDTALPSTRVLASSLGVARGVVVEAYEQLVAEGYLVSRAGGSTRVARVPLVPPAEPRPATSEPPEFDFRPGQPDLREFPRGAWLRSVRRVVGGAPAERFGYLDGYGLPELRAALSAYLDRVRGTHTSPDRIVVTSGFAQGIRLIGQALRASGVRRVAVEDPWSTEYRDRLTASGLELVPIPVDDDGLRVADLERAAVRAVVLTPAHQFPTGAVLSPERRASLMAWADQVDGVIVEDDYDAEFRYDRDPIGAMQGLCAERVVYAGTASKTLAPGLRLGWLALPRALADRVAVAKKGSDHGSSAIEQLALADFIERGELDRHLRRLRTVYRRRRDAILGSLARWLPEADPCGASAGLHVLAWLPPDIDDAAVVRAAGAAGIGVQDVTSGTLLEGSRRGLIFGYGTLDEARIDAGIRRLAEVIHSDEKRAPG